MTTIKTDTVLVSFKGEPLKESGGESLKVGAVISTILGGKVSNPTLGWILGKKFATEESVDLKAEEVVFIKKELEQNQASKEYGFNAVVIGQLINLLDGEKEEKSKEPKK